MTSADIRQAFLEYFQAHGHQAVSSSALIPANDPTLLFTNAGMVQFKDVFLGLEKRDYNTAVSSQRCVRAGGKHNDLENVGYTARHHTFFEMLGNFSFGKYFKREAIHFAWKFLTEVLQLPKERLWVTVYKDDDEAAAIWLEEIGIDPNAFSRCGDEDNFWAMGDTGPCGPCTEIFYDHGPDIPGGPPGSPDADADRYIEIWNLVFMQYERDSRGELTPLAMPCVDTGMGLERIAAVMQGVHDNYDIDLFQHLIIAIAKLSHTKDLSNKSLRVIADHIRACSFLIIDGVTPSNEGRGYVLRRIIRRAIRHGHQLGLREPFFFQLVSALADIMGAAYPELLREKAFVEQVLLQEEKQFAETLENGLVVFESAIAKLSTPIIPGEILFQLYDTFGFPVDLTADIARERGLQCDLEGYERCMQAQRKRSKQASQFQMELAVPTDCDWRSQFTGYDSEQSEARIVGLIENSASVENLRSKQSAIVVLDKTPFYAESGGQVGDTGVLKTSHGEFTVHDTQKQGKMILHFGVLTSGTFTIDDTVIAQIDVERRQAIRVNHSATHLLHAVLRHELGDKVLQKGSLVAPDRLRFDFTFPHAVSPTALAKIEQAVNRQIRNNVASETTIMSIEEAKQSGAIALFGEKYDAKVRVLTIGDYSKELCGGTHVARTGDIGFFKVLSESAVASGVRRIEALTGQAASDYVQQRFTEMQSLAALVKTDVAGLPAKISTLLANEKKLQKNLSDIKQQLSTQQSGDLISQAQQIDNVHVLAAALPGADAKILRDTVDQIKNKLGTAAVVLATTNGSKVNLVAGVTKDIISRITAKSLVNYVAEQVGGKGGGRDDMAQAGGTKPEALSAALAGVNDWLKTQLG